MRTQIGRRVVAVQLLEPGPAPTVSPIAVSGDATSVGRLEPGAAAEFPDVAAALETGLAHVATRDLPPATAALYGDMAQALSMTIMVGGRVLGLVSVLDNGHEPLPEDELTMLRRAADMVGAHLERQASNTRLQELLESKDRFIASVSHELRTPITAVMGLAQILAGSDFEAASPDEVKELLSTVAEQSAEVAQIVEDLLVAARAEDGTLTVTPRSVDVRAEIDAVLAGARHAGQQGGDAIVCGAGVAWVDPLRFRQIIRNLVSNAWRYGGPRVEVSIEQRDRETVIVVSDDGAGIPEDKRESVFEPYETAHPTSSLPGSIGLGLSVSRGLARLMDGDLFLDGLIGTSFVLVLPVPSEAPKGPIEAGRGSGR
jgi:signal transduction histidine kinase